MIFNAFFFNHHSFSTHFHSFCSPQVYFYNDFFHNSSFCLFLSSKEIRYHFVLIPTVSFCYFHSMLLLLLYHSLNDSSFKHVIQILFTVLITCFYFFLLLRKIMFPHFTMIYFFHSNCKCFNKYMAFTFTNFKDNTAIIITANICNCNKDIINTSWQLLQTVD